MKSEDFTPEINYWGRESWNQISLKNLIKYPLGFIVVLTWMIVCLSLILLFYKQYHIRFMPHCCKCDKIDDKPLIAQYGDLKNHRKLSKILNNEKLKQKYRSIQEIRIVKDDQLKHRSYFVQFWHLYLLNLKNEHLWFGICFRNFGTSYTYTQRISILMIRFLVTLSTSALFYGRAKNRAIGDVSLMMYESLLGFLPIFIIKRCIKRHKPGINEWEVDKHGNVNNTSIIGKYSNDEHEMAMFATLQLTKIKRNSVKSVSIKSPASPDPTTPHDQKSGAPTTPSININYNTDTDGEGGNGDNTSPADATIQALAASSVSSVTKEHVFDFVNQATQRKESIAGTLALSNNDSNLKPPLKTSNSNKTIARDEKTKDGEINDGGTSDHGEIDDIPIEVLFGAIDDNNNGTNIKGDKFESQQSVNATKFVIKEEIRQRLLNKMYKYPHWCKYVAMGCIVVLSLTCAIITTLWCLWFDAQLFLTNNYQLQFDYYTKNCTSSESVSVLPYKTFLNYNSTEYEMNLIFSQFDGYFYSPESSNDSFGDNYTVAQRFLLCVFLSYILSIFWWQPLILAIKSLFLLKKYVNNPNQINEAMLFYSQNNFHDVGKKRKNLNVHVGTTKPEIIKTTTTLQTTVSKELKVMATHKDGHDEMNETDNDGDENNNNTNVHKQKEDEILLGNVDIILQDAWSKNKNEGIENSDYLQSD